jgi:hypothetical protein
MKLIIDEAIFKQLTADNAVSMLIRIPCPNCEEVGQFGTFRNYNNNGVGLICLACDEQHPFSSFKCTWLRQGAVKRSNNVQQVMKERGYFCYGCGEDYEVLKAAGIGMHEHHARPFMTNGNDGPTIPLCGICHPVITAVQRYHRQRFHPE